MKRLGVNIDHVATVRNARGERHPDPYYAALQVVKMGADSVTIHLREDRRHINDLDAESLISLNLLSSPAFLILKKRKIPSLTAQKIIAPPSIKLAMF